MQLIAIEGIDGAGKTTIAQNVATELSHRGVVFVSRKHTGDDAFISGELSLLSRLIWQTSRVHDAALPPDYWLHLQAAWYAAFSRTIIEPALARHRAVIVDGWYYKFFAKLLVRGYKKRELEQIFSASRKPDTVILLHVTPETAWSRGRSFSVTEMGSHQGYEPGRDSYIEYQKAVLTSLRKIGRHWKRIAVTPHCTAGQTTAAVVDCVRELLRMQPTVESEVRLDGMWPVPSLAPT